MAGGHPRRLDRAAAVREFDGEDRVVVVADGLVLVAYRGVNVSADVAERLRPLGDDGCQPPGADRLRRTADELRDIGHVAADVGQRARSGRTPITPAHRRLRAAAIVGPIPAAEMQHLAELAGLYEVAYEGDAGRAAEGEADARDGRRRVRRVGHRSRILQVSLSGFSHSTCLPAASSPSTTSRCSELAMTTLTTSMSSACAIACHDVSLRAYPKRRAANEPNSAFTSPIDTRRTGGSSGEYSEGATR